MLPHQAAYLDHLLEVVDSEGVDVVVVAGDVYDRGLPPVDAVSLASEALGRLARSRAQVVISSGNHDSARRLGFASDLIAHAGIHLRTDASRLEEPVVLEDGHGPVAIYGIPYLDPEVCKRAWFLPVRSHEAALTEAMTRVRADLATRAGARSVVLAHAFVAGGQPSDSERDISVGGVDRVPVSVFGGIDYVALGHLHGQQTLRENVRYSGSPLAYSFSEANHHKGSWLVDLGTQGVKCEFISAPVARRLARVHGTLDELLIDPALSAHEDAWIQATLTDAARPLNAMDRLRKRFPHALALTYLPAHLDASARPLREAVSDHDLVLQFVEHARGTRASGAEADLVADALAACCEDTDADAAVGA
jgi:exonuclease SbcD